MNTIQDTAPEYPEHEKLAQISDQSQAIGEFIQFGEYDLCRFDEDEEEYVPVTAPVEEILAEYFGIDLKRLEAEKRQMLAEMRGETSDGVSS